MASYLPQSFAADRTISGNFQLSDVTLIGSSTYTILYKYPSVVLWGNNLTIGITVEVNQLSGLFLYLFTYGVTVTVFSANGLATMQLVKGGGADQSDFLYQGAHWGPLNVTISINHQVLGNSSQPLSGNISVQFIDNLQLDRSATNPYGTYEESGSQTIGNFTIVNAPSGPQINENYLLVFIPVVIIFMIFILWLTRSRRIKKYEVPDLSMN